MSLGGSNSNNIVRYILANSLFTPRQLAIISKRLHTRGKEGNISSGAYYRQVKQCREKVISVLYSAVLLQSTGILQPDSLVALNRLAEQLSVMFASGSSDISSSEQRMNDVISVIDQLVKRMSNL